MELGNMCFGNSRGPIEVPRELVDSDEWIELMHYVLQVEDYHCALNSDGYYYDYDSREYKKRTNGIVPDKFGGYTLTKNGKIIFQLFPYWWGDCTCGVEQKNNKLFRSWKKELFTPYQWKTYMTFDEWCEDDCPACSWKEENKDKTQEELINICTCGTVKKNIRLKKRKEKINDKIKEFEKREMTQYIDHEKTCALLKHNFIYHPNQPDEFWIDWYKYPFRDSYMNKEMTNEEILKIFTDCINEFNGR